MFTETFDLTATCAGKGHSILDGGFCDCGTVQDGDDSPTLIGVPVTAAEYGRYQQVHGEMLASGRSKSDAALWAANAVGLGDLAAECDECDEPVTTSAVRDGYPTGRVWCSEDCQATARERQVMG